MENFRLCLCSLPNKKICLNLKTSLNNFILDFGYKQLSFIHSVGHDYS